MGVINPFDYKSGYIPALSMKLNSFINGETIEFIPHLSISFRILSLPAVFLLFS